LRFFVTLTAVVDPFLAVPFFITFTASYSEAERAALARVVVLTVLAVLAVSTFIGDGLLAMMGASLPAFRVGGGSCCC
jgi:multiple antibiotic resistance protein